MGKVKPHGSLRGTQPPVVHPRVHTGANITLVTINDRRMAQRAHSKAVVGTNL